LGATAHGVASRLVGCGRDGDSHAEFRSDLILAALERWPKFDPSRGRPMAFLAIAMTRAGTSILRAQHAAKRGGQTTTLPLSDVPGAGHGLAPSLSVVYPIARRELELDVRAAIDALPRDLATVCNSFLEAATDGRRRPSLGAAASAALRRHFESVGFSEHMS
jgi:DNA-directed RNA polymerase specialized sigma24 family protein